MKANERDSRTEQERFIDRMLKEILGGQRNPGDRLPTESELAAQYDLRKTNVHLALKELERLGFLEIVPRHATYVAPYWERANLETLAVIMTHGGTPHPELVDAFLELREMVALGWFCWVGRRPDAVQMQKLYGLLAQMDAIAYVPDGDKAAFLELLNAFLVCMFRESDNMIFRVMLRCGCAQRADVLKSGNNTERERAHEADIYPRRPRGDRQLHPARDRRALRPDRLRHAAGARPV